MITEGYAQTVRRKDAAIKKYMEGEYNDEDFLMALKQAGFGPTKAKEVLDAQRKIKHGAVLANTIAKKTDEELARKERLAKLGALRKPVQKDPGMKVTQISRGNDGHKVIVVKKNEPEEVKKIPAKIKRGSKGPRTTGVIVIPRETGKPARGFVDRVKFLVRHRNFDAHDMEKKLIKTIADFEHKKVQNTSTNIYDKIGEDIGHMMHEKYLKDFIDTYYSKYFNGDGSMKASIVTEDMVDDIYDMLAEGIEEDTNWFKY